MTRWYRAYAGTVKDDKLAEVAIVAGCSRSVAIAAWHAILESAAETDEAGRFETTSRRVAAALGEPSPVIEAVFAAMAEIGMVTGMSVSAWKRRQYESDSSTERSRKHREAKRNASATLQGRSETPPDTETEADTEEGTDVPSTGSRSEQPAAAPDQQAGQGKIDYDEVQTWASSLVGTNPVAVNLDISPVIALLRAGFSRERVEIGIRAACSAARQPIKSWKTFDGWVKNTAAEVAPVAKPKQVDPNERYRAMAQSWERGTWSDFWGPEPGQPGCRVPVEFLPTQSPTGKEAA